MPILRVLSTPEYELLHKPIIRGDAMPAITLVYDLHDKERHDSLVVRFREKFGEGLGWQNMEEIKILEQSLHGLWTESFSVREIIEYFLDDMPNWREFVFSKDRQRGVVKYDVHKAFAYEHLVAVIVACLVRVSLTESESEDLISWNKSSTPMHDIPFLVNHALIQAERIRKDLPVQDPNQDSGVAIQVVEVLVANVGTVKGVISVSGMSDLERHMSKLVGHTKQMQVARFILTTLVRYVSERLDIKCLPSVHKNKVSFGNTTDFYRFLSEDGRCPVRLDNDSGMMLRWLAIKLLCNKTRVIFVEDGSSKNKLLYINPVFFSRVTGRDLLTAEMQMVDDEDTSMTPNPSVEVEKAVIAPKVVDKRSIATPTPKSSSGKVAKESLLVTSSVEFLMGVINSTLPIDDLATFEARLAEHETALNTELERVSHRKENIEKQLSLIDVFKQLMVSGNHG